MVKWKQILKGIKTYGSLWLIPVQEQLLTLQKIINQLSEDNGSPNFLPHCTLLTKVCDDKNKISKNLKKFCSKQSCIELQVTGIQSEDLLFKSLYIQFKMDELILEFQQNLSNIINYNETYQFYPHLSIMYKKLSPSKNNKISSNISIPKIIKFNQISFVETGEDIHNWKQIYSEKL